MKLKQTNLFGDFFLSSCFLVTLDPQKDVGHRNRASPKYFPGGSYMAIWSSKVTLVGVRAISEAKMKIADNRIYDSMHNF